MKKVLVAEDEESIREFIVINLSRSGYTVEQAENGLVALQKFKQDEEGFDVAILDIMMPRSDESLRSSLHTASPSSSGIIISRIATSKPSSSCLNF